MNFLTQVTNSLSRGSWFSHGCSFVRDGEEMGQALQGTAGMPSLLPFSYRLRYQAVQRWEKASRLSGGVLPFQCALLGSEGSRCLTVHIKSTWKAPGAPQLKGPLLWPLRSVRGGCWRILGRQPAGLGSVSHTRVCAGASGSLAARGVGGGGGCWRRRDARLSPFTCVSRCLCRGGGGVCGYIFCSGAGLVELSE